MDRDAKHRCTQAQKFTFWFSVLEVLAIALDRTKQQIQCHMILRYGHMVPMCTCVIAMRYDLVRVVIHTTTL